MHACVPKGPYRYEITAGDLLPGRIIVESEIVELKSVKNQVKIATLGKCHCLLSQMRKC